MSFERARQESPGAETQRAAGSEDAEVAFALRAAGMGTWRWDVRSGQVAWTSETHRLFGLVGEPVAQSYGSFLERIHPDDRPAVAQKLARAVHTCGANFMEFRIVRSDGSERWMACTARVFPGDDGKAAIMAGVIADVTDRRATVALAESAARDVPSAVQAFATRDAAQLLGVGEATVKRLTNSGLIECLRSEARGFRRFTPAQLVAFLRRGKATTRAATINLDAAARSFAVAAAENDVAGAAALAIELFAVGVPLDRMLDTLLVPVADRVIGRFTDMFLQRVPPLGPMQRPGRQQAALVVPIGRPISPPTAMISALFRAYGFESVLPAENLAPLHLVHLAVRSRVRLAAFVFCGQLSAERVADEAIAAAMQIAENLPYGTVCAYGPRLHELPPGVVGIRSMQDLGALIGRSWEPSGSIR